jgi:hypothetical protein
MPFELKIKFEINPKLHFGACISIYDNTSTIIFFGPQIPDDFRPWHCGLTMITDVFYNPIIVNSTTVYLNTAKRLWAELLESCFIDNWEQVIKYNHENDN